MVESAEARGKKDSFRECNKEFHLGVLRARKADYEGVKDTHTLTEDQYAMWWVFQWKFCF